MRDAGEETADNISIVYKYIRITYIAFEQRKSERK